jgi:hypothetical protein
MKNKIHPLTAALILLGLSILLNHVYIQTKLQLPMNSLTIKAHITAVVQETFFPLLIMALIVFLPIHVSRRIKIITGFTQFLLLLPLIDLFHFKITLNRFDWKIWHDLNFYSIKAVAGLSELVFLLFIGFLFYFNLKKLKRFNSSSGSTTIFLQVYLPRVLLALILVYLFVPLEFYKHKSRFSGIARPIMGKNRFIEIINQGFLHGFINFNRYSHRSQNIRPQFLNAEEIAFLKTQGFLPPENSHSLSEANNYQRIILVVMESMALEYIHSYNKNIPKETTAFIDSLIKKYPDLNNFHASDNPTINGLNAMLMSRIPFNPEIEKKLNFTSLPELLKKHFSFDAKLLRGVSKFYSGENLLIESLFDFNHQISYEELSEKYPEPPFGSWGYHDDVVFSEGINIIEKNQNKRLFLLLKTIDQHQPPHYCGLPDAQLPESVKKHPNPIIKCIYWADYNLKMFFEALENKKLFDDKTLIIITSDHYAFPGYGHTDLIKNQKYSRLGKIPLIFISKNKKFWNKISKDKMSCQLDLAPTICDSLGIPIPESFMGQSLFNPDAVSRALGMDNDQVILKNEAHEFSFDINKKTQNRAINKWLNNLKIAPQSK